MISLQIKRHFKWFSTFDLKIFQDEKHLLTISTANDFLKLKYLIPHNETGFQITIQTDTKILFNDERFELKVDKMYPFKNKYAEVWYNNQKTGEILFEKKALHIVLNFIPDHSVEISENKALKIAILVLLNILDLDGSE